MNLSIIPNLVSASRIALIYPIVVLLQTEQYELALLVFTIACATDLIDGYLARSFNWQSRIGGWLDPIADKFLLNATYLALWLMDRDLIPLWLLVCVLGRDLLIVFGVIYYYFKVERLTASPTTISKVNTLMQLILIFLVLLHQALLQNQLAGVPTILLDGSMFVVLGLTLASGTGYLIIGCKRVLLLRKGVS